MITKEECRAAEYAKIDYCIINDYSEYEKILTKLEKWKKALESTYDSNDTDLMHQTFKRFDRFYDRAYDRLNLRTLKLDLRDKREKIRHDFDEVYSPIIRRIKEDQAKANAKAEAEAREKKRIERNAKQREKRASKKAAMIGEAQNLHYPKGVKYDR